MYDYVIYSLVFVDMFSLCSLLFQMISQQAFGLLYGCFIDDDDDDCFNFRWVLGGMDNLPWTSPQ